MLDYDKMITYKVVPFKTMLPYPIISQLEAYTEHYRLNYMDRANPDKGYHAYQHNELLQIVVIGGINNYFLIYTYPPAGFEIADPTELETLTLWQGYILQWQPLPKTYRLDVNTIDHGETAFKARKQELGY
jgi:hypothetical protein